MWTSVPSDKNTVGAEIKELHMWKERERLMSDYQHLYKAEQSNIKSTDAYILLFNLKSLFIIYVHFKQKCQTTAGFTALVFGKFWIKEVAVKCN